MIKHTRRKLLPKLLALLLCAGVLLSLPVGVTLSASAVTQAEIDALRGDASDLAAQKAELQKKLDAISADKDKAMEQKEILEQQINVIQDEIKNITAQISQYDQLISEKEEELRQAEEKEQEQYELFCKRVRSMEEEGEVSYWEILFGSQDFSDLLDNVMIVNEIMDYDNAIMNELLALQQQIETDKAALEDARAQQEQAKAQQESARAELKSQQDEVDALVAQISAQQSQVEDAIEELEAAASEMDRLIRQKEKEYQAQISNVTSEKGFAWPLPGRTNLSSLFAGRLDPFTGKPANHTGIDIPAPGGTEIHAAKSGVVTTATYNSSYGNYVVISHSDGTSTLYAHMKTKAIVSVGQTVSQGQVVGYVGTTGRSTGNHLHFEIRVNGTRVDPVNYFSGLTYGGVAIG